MAGTPEEAQAHHQFSPKGKDPEPYTTVPSTIGSDIHESQPRKPHPEPYTTEPSTIGSDIHESQPQQPPPEPYTTEPSTIGSDIHESQPQQPPPEPYTTEPSTIGGDIHESQPQQQPPSAPSEEDTKKWGTHIMGAPAAPGVHPDNQKAALWKASDSQQIDHQQQQQQQQQQSPYVQHSPINKATNNPFEPAIQFFNSWSTKAETIARNIWHNLKTGPSVSEVAWGKMNLTAKAITGGGFESLFKQIFETEPNEKLKKTFACYFSTSTGPVAGTLYLSTARLAFCSDRPLTFTAPSGQPAWSYYKVMIPIANVGTVNPVVMKENPPEKYLQIVTTDGHEFWFMGFVNFEKASHHLLDSVSDFRAVGDAVPPVVA